MIKGIYQSGRYVVVSGGNPPPSPYIPTHYGGSTNGPQGFTGQIRYSPTNSCMEVFEGSSWQMMQTTMTNVGLSPDAELAIDWARKKMLEEMDLKARMEKHPGLKDAYEKFQIMDALTLEEDKNDHGVQTSP